MPQITQSTLMPYSQQALYNLINQVEDYPQFIPFCTQATVQERSTTHLQASITLQKGPLSETFTTRNELIPFEKMILHLVDGPFKKLEGSWSFASRPNGCTLVTLELQYDFSSFIVATVFGALFKKVTNDLITNFHRYAKKTLG